LDSFLAEKTCTDIDRTKYIPFSLKDNVKKYTICFIFNCNSHTNEDPTITPVQYTGVVIHLPAYWLEVPKELSYTYLVNLIQEVYEDTFTQWDIDQAGSNATNSGTNCGCGCNPGGWNPV
jgi:hypothetical protein